MGRAALLPCHEQAPYPCYNNCPPSPAAPGHQKPGKIDANPHRLYNPLGPLTAILVLAAPAVAVPPAAASAVVLAVPAAAAAHCQHGELCEGCWWEAPARAIRRLFEMHARAAHCLLHCRHPGLRVCCTCHRQDQQHLQYCHQLCWEGGGGGGLVSHLYSQ